MSSVPSGPTLQVVNCRRPLRAPPTGRWPCGGEVQFKRWVVNVDDRISQRGARSMLNWSPRTPPLSALSAGWPAPAEKDVTTFMPGNERPGFQQFDGFGGIAGHQRMQREKHAAKQREAERMKLA